MAHLLLMTDNIHCYLLHQALLKEIVSLIFRYLLFFNNLINFFGLLHYFGETKIHFIFELKLASLSNFLKFY